MLDTTELAMKILPEDIQITIPIEFNKDIMPFIRMGVRDIGRLDVARERELKIDPKKQLKEIELKLKPKKMKLQRRLPIFSKYIANGWYSRKTAQLLDKYKILLKNSEENEDKE